MEYDAAMRIRLPRRLSEAIAAAAASEHLSVSAYTRRLLWRDAESYAQNDHERPSRRSSVLRSRSDQGATEDVRERYPT